MDITVFILSLFGLQAICLIYGSMAARGLKSQEDYYLAGKSVRFFPLMMTFVATQIGGGLFLGSSEEAYKYGWWVLLYPLGYSLGFILLGCGIGSRLNAFNVSTIAQILEVVYRSPLLKKVASFFSILSLFMVLVAQFMASNKFMISLGIDSKLVFIGFWAIVIIYTSTGGLKAVVATDIIQALFFIAVFFVAFGYAFSLQNISMEELIAKTANEEITFTASQFCGWLLMPLLFMVIEQDMGQRCFAAASKKVVSKATIYAGVCTLIVCSIPVFFGVLAKEIGALAPSGGSILMAVIQQTTSPLVSALIGCAILAAIISTADSLINAIGSNLSQDFDVAIFKKNIRASQAITASIAVAAIFMSFQFESVLGVMIQSYELAVSCLFVPIVAAIFRKRGNALSAVLAIFFGAAGFVLFRIFLSELPKEILSIALSCAGFILGEIVLRYKQKQVLLIKN